MKTNILTAALLLTSALVATAPAYAAVATHNAAGMSKVTADNRASGDRDPKLAYSYTRGFGTDRSRGVLAFSNPSTGIYCIQPSSTVNLLKIFPLVSIEWGNSSGESLQVFWQDTSQFSDCPAGNLEVRTYDISTGTAPVLTANVAFDIVVP